MDIRGHYIHMGEYVLSHTNRTTISRLARYSFLLGTCSGHRKCTSSTSSPCGFAYQKMCAHHHHTQICICKEIRNSVNDFSVWTTKNIRSNNPQHISIQHYFLYQTTISNCNKAFYDSKQNQVLKAAYNGCGDYSETFANECRGCCCFASSTAKYGEMHFGD